MEGQKQKVVPWPVIRGRSENGESVLVWLDDVSGVQVSNNRIFFRTNGAVITMSFDSAIKAERQFNRLASLFEAVHIEDL
jgi:hypothetical protein